MKRGLIGLEIRSRRVAQNSNFIQGRLVVFNLAALNPPVFLQLAGSCRKGIAQRHVHILMRLLVMMVPADHDLLVGYTDVQPDLVQIALVLVVMLRLDGNPTTDDVVAVLFQLGCFFPDAGFHGIGVRDATKSDLKW